MRSLAAATFATALLFGAATLAVAAESTTTGMTPAPSTATGQSTGKTTEGPGTGTAATERSGTSTAPMTQTEVKQKLEMAGYTSVTGLKAGTDGSWTGKATHNGKQVSVAVDTHGTITAQ